MAGIIVSGDTSGAVTLSAPAVAGTVTVTLPASSGTMLTTTSTTGISGSAISSGTVPEAYGGTGTSTGYYGFKNRIINGGMVIDQRNAGGTLSAIANNIYLLDRYKFTGSASVASKLNFAQNLNSVTGPVGFPSYLGLQTATTYTVSGSDLGVVEQIIEGYNIRDLAWGTASAKSITISFWVYSSLTGTFGGCLKNSGYSFSYPFTYSIPTANTWTYISININAPTTGTWDTTNGVGLRVMIGLGAGATASGTANETWQSADYYSATGTVSIFGTSSATFYITGVQLEKGSTATSFDYRPYGTELALCQRYFQIVGGTDTEHFAPGVMGTSRINIVYSFKQTMRATPSFTATSFGSAFSNLSIFNGTTTFTVTGTNENYMAPNTASIGFTHGGSSTAGDAGYIYFNSTSAKVAFSAEL